MLVFIEVRYRRLNKYGTSAESVGPKKQQKLIKTAWHFLKNQGLIDKPSRFDIVALNQSLNSGKIGLNWIQNAFQPD
jgi:putative endonuclease